MTEPQIWVLIAVFTTLMIGGMNLISRTVRVEIRGLADAMNAKFETVDAKFETLTVTLRSEIVQSEHRLNARMDETEHRLNARIDETEERLNVRITQTEQSLIRRIDQLDSDVHAITHKIFPKD